MIILDRFEGNYAVIEVDGEMIDVEKDLVNGQAKEGDVLNLVDGIYYKDKEGSEKRRKYIADKFKNMWED